MFFNKNFRIKRCIEIVIGGKHILVCGYGDVGKACCSALKALNAVVYVSEIDPICALQACMHGFQVVLLNEMVPKVDVIITATGARNIITRKEVEKMKNGSVICNMGLMGEIDIASLKKEDVTWEKLRTEVHQLLLPNNKRILLLAEGRVVNHSCSAISYFNASIITCTQVLGLIELFTAPEGRYRNGDIYLLPKNLDEYIANLHLPVFDAHLTELTKTQAEHLGINVTGPFKPQYYSY